MPIGVPDAAVRLGLSERRLRALIAAGHLHADRFGREWMLDEADIARHEARSHGRPLSERSAWALINLASGRGMEDIFPSEQSRARARLRRLLAEESPERLLRSWLAARAVRRAYRASPQDLDDLRADPRLRQSGVSHPESGISAADIAEGYISASDLDAVVHEYLLAEAPDGKGNVIFHVAGRPVPEVYPLLLAADLAEHQSPREEGRAAEIVSAMRGPM
jgi:excisionase family DNA binding protein